MAGKDIATLPLVDVIYDGPKSYGLRLIANGRYASADFAKSFRESCVMQSLLQELRKREEHNRAIPVVDIDAIAEALAREKHLPFVKPADKKVAYGLVAEHMAATLKAMSPSSQEDTLRKRIEELELENAKLISSSSTRTRAEEKPAQSVREMLGAKEPVLPAEDAYDSGTRTPKGGAAPYDEEEAHDQLQQYRRGTRKQYLAENGPIAKGERMFKNFVKDLRISAQKRKTMDIKMKEANKWLAGLTPVEKTGLPGMAVEWGMPVKLAASLDNIHLTKCIMIADCLAGK